MSPLLVQLNLIEEVYHGIVQVVVDKIRGVVSSEHWDEICNCSPDKSLAMVPEAQDYFAGALEPLIHELDGAKEVLSET